jgi:glycosyltransferase involved in cell wall biosynthesis
MPAISIALCVCNGARFLGEQLSSLRDQSRLPDELVVGDDASEDESVAIVERFAEEVPFPVRLFRNSPRLGVRGNFEKVISHCSHELIALCDQDDIWLPEKLAVLASSLEEDTSVVATFSDASVVDEKLQPLGYTMWEYVGFSAKRRNPMNLDRPWQPLFKDPVVTGATLMFRKRLVDVCLPIPDGWVHDAWIAQIAAAHGKIRPVEQPLILYRQHSSNVIGGRRLSLHAQMRKAEAIGRKNLAEREYSRYQQLLNRLSALDETPRLRIMRDLAAAKLKHLKRRRNLPANRIRRVPAVVSEVLKGNYRRFAKDWRNVAADLLMS